MYAAIVKSICVDGSRWNLKSAMSQMKIYIFYIVLAKAVSGNYSLRNICAIAKITKELYKCA